MNDYTPHEQLEQLLGLDLGNLKVIGAVLFGTSGAATLTVSLSNGNELEFDPARSMARPQTLLAELAVAANVTPDLKQKQCLTALRLASSIAARHEQMTEADQARDWGTQYLQAARTLDVDTTDQGARWGAWSYLSNHDPQTTSRNDDMDLARAGVVLRDTDGSRLVRSGWMLAFVRSIAPRVSHIRLPTLLAQIGWHAPKRIKATSPASSETLAWTFYTVPAEWEADR